MAEGGIDPREAERKEVKELMDHILMKGDTWYLLDIHWFHQWKRYIGWDELEGTDPNSHPGPVDNSSILSGQTLKEHLTEDVDFVLVPEKVWDLFCTQYTLAIGQEPIGRKVVDQGLLSSYLGIEIYLTELKVARYPEVEKTISLSFSKTDSLENVEQAFRKAFRVPDSQPVRLLNRLDGNQTYEELAQKKQSIQELSLTSSQTIVGEVRNEDGTWPRKTQSSSKRMVSGSSSNVSSYSSRYADSDSSSSSRYVQPGLCGLNNLGNTCFMNSVLQCMSNTPPITRYFLEERHWAELNRDNPLGNQGEIAKAFADLLKAMWSGNHQSFAPRQFKLQVGRFAPQFSGYQQHDSQELLTFLLDGLHEDLNRIVKKPYLEMKDADGRSDERVAQEAWEMYRKRNDSVIVDLFHGLLKSTLVCPECGKVSVTFDPTCYLSLPMPVKKERQIEVYLVPLDPDRKTVRYRLTVPKMGNVGDLCEALSKLSGVPADRLVAADVHQNRFHQVFTAESHLSQINDRDAIYLYELADKVGLPGTCCLSVYLKEVRTKNSYGVGPMFGVPFMIQVAREGLDYDRLYQSILERMKRYVKPATASDADALTSPSSSASSAASSTSSSLDSPKNETTAANDTGEEPSDMDVDAAPATANGIDAAVPRQLFSLELVNASGNTSMNKLKTSNRAISFSAKSYVTCEWDPAVKEAHYDADLAEDTDEDASFLHRPVAKKQVLQLRECLELFTTTERLGADDAWYCPACKKHQRATKKFDLWSLPDVLVIHLKRFSYTRSLRDKLDTLVEFPAHGLDMTPYVINRNHPPAAYDLIGVCNHYGGLGGGHYTAYAKNKDDGRWYYFDDSSVSEATEEQVCSKAAYVLFYSRRNSSDRWLSNIRGPVAKTIASATSRAGSGPTSAGQGANNKDSDDDQDEQDDDDEEVAMDAS